MKRYIIKAVSTATADNPSFAGEVHTWWIGKGDKHLGLKVDNAKTWHEEFDLLNRWNIKDFGYARKCDAVRNYSYRNPENTKFWTTEVEVVEFEI